MTRPPLVDVAAVTDVGARRHRNEDSVCALDWSSSVERGEVLWAKRLVTAPTIVAVVDGMGGHADGRRASRIVVDSLLRSAPSMVDGDAVVAAVVRANEALYEEMHEVPTARGMGATVAGLVVGPAGIMGFNVGDAALYERVDGYLIGRFVADRPPGLPGQAGQTSVVTQTLGGTDIPVAIMPHVWTVPWGDDPADRFFLLCSDGLTDTLAIDSIEQVCSEAPTTAEAAAQLKHRALAASPADNVSIAVVNVTPRSQ